MYEEQQPIKTSKGLSIPTAIILAGVLIASSYYFVNRSHAVISPKENTASVAEAQTPKIVIDPVTEQDHILGNPQAKIVMVEYSDLECPYCKLYHKTMLKIMDEYGKDGTVAWVYRHFPLDSLHTKARNEAEASECASELGGNQAFWDFINNVYGTTPSNNGLDPTKLPEIAVKIGLNKDAFVACLASGKYKDKVEAQFQSGLRAGITGTPSTFFFSKGNDTIPLEGAQAHPSVKGTIDTILTTMR